MAQNRSHKQYPQEFKEEAVALVTEQSYTVTKAAEALGVATCYIAGRSKLSNARLA